MVLCLFPQLLTAWWRGDSVRRLSHSLLLVTPLCVFVWILNVSEIIKRVPPLSSESFYVRLHVFGMTQATSSNFTNPLWGSAVQQAKHVCSKLRNGKAKPSCHGGGNVIIRDCSPTSSTTTWHDVCLLHRPPGKQPVTPDSPSPCKPSDESALQASAAARGGGEEGGWRHQEV